MMVENLLLSVHFYCCFLSITNTKKPLLLNKLARVRIVTVITRFLLEDIYTNLLPTAKLAGTSLGNLV